MRIPHHGVMFAAEKLLSLTILLSTKSLRIKPERNK
jgi:hypothetical protein